MFQLKYTIKSKTRRTLRAYNTYTMKVILDTIEEKIKAILLQYSKEFTQRGNPELTLRFTGGWVRDKLLNRDSHDIDVAIDKTTGEEFAVGLHNFMVDRGIDETGVHKIAVNPEKSKHLETATTRICGLDVDFVNLRSEEYANSDSRVPSSVKFGTPSQDAFRRDATLNALFYNLTTGEVEDFTGKGLADLEAHILRTPLEPNETFSDDPLRVLRLLRFVGQLGFSVATDTLEAMRGSYVGTNIATKISGERVGTEMLKLLESSHAAKALDYFINLGLGPYVFRVPDSNIHAETEQLNVRFDALKKVFSCPYTDLVPTNKSDRSMLWLAGLLQDLNHGEQVPMIVQDGLKLTRLMKDGCKKLVNSADLFDDLFAKFNASNASRVDMGRYVRSLGTYWALGLSFNASRVVLEAGEAGIQKVQELYAAINEANLNKAYELKPLVAGKELMSLLGKKPGPWMQQALAREVEFILAHPEATKEQVIDWAKKEIH